MSEDKQTINQSFAKKYRIVKPAQYKFLFNKPKRARDNNFIILAKKNKQDFPRLGLAISKKSIKLAVQRNRIKRLIKEYFRTQVIISDQAIDFVVMAQKNINTSSNKTLLISLNTIFKKLISQIA
ncbi:MAG: ribonuclease P protein component [Pseudomonadota bacterium]